MNEEERERGDEVPCKPWWTTEEGLARMRELEAEADKLDNELNRRKA